MTDLALPAQVSVYMVGTTVLRIIVYLIGLALVTRITSFNKQAKMTSFAVAAVALVGWTLLVAVQGRNGLFRIDQNTTFPPPIALAVVIPIILAYAVFQYSATWRKIIYHIPQPWLIGVHTFRITGGMILVLYVRGLLPGEFAFLAGIGDVLVGLTAVPVAYFYYKQKSWSRRLAVWWNYFGLAEMILALLLGILTSPSPLQLLAIDRPNLLTTTYPVVLFPLFSVSVGIILHLYSLARLQQPEAVEIRSTSPKMAWWLLAFFGVAAFLYSAAFYIVFPLLTDRPLGFQIHRFLQETFAAHPVGLYIHILPSMLAILLGPFQFLVNFRNTHIRLHRWLGRIYLGGVLVGGLAGLYMAQFSFAGLPAQLGFSLLAVLWLFSGYMAYSNIRRGRIEAHQEWMMRNYALTFAAAMLRIYTRTFISMGMTAPDFHHINAWLCWVPNLIIVEWLIYRSRVRRTGRPSTRSGSGHSPGIVQKLSENHSVSNIDI